MIIYTPECPYMPRVHIADLEKGSKYQIRNSNPNVRLTWAYLKWFNFSTLD